jgi:transcription elongation factor Elf1
MSTGITEKQKAAYLKNPNRCIFCKSTELSVEGGEVNDKSYYEYVLCDKCGKSWTDIYTLTDLEVEES